LDCFKPFNQLLPRKLLAIIADYVADVASLLPMTGSFFEFQKGIKWFKSYEGATIEEIARLPSSKPYRDSDPIERSLHAALEYITSDRIHYRYLPSQPGFLMTGLFRAYQMCLAEELPFDYDTLGTILPFIVNRNRIRFFSYAVKGAIDQGGWEDSPKMAATLADELWSTQAVDAPAFRITTLSIHQQPLTFLPAEIGRFTSLKTLRIVSCGVISVSPRIQDCAALETLDLENNALYTRPKLCIPSLNLRNNFLSRDESPQKPLSNLIPPPRRYERRPPEFFHAATCIASSPCHMPTAFQLLRSLCGSLGKRDRAASLIDSPEAVAGLGCKKEKLLPLQSKK
jgi:Leucine-rich repeat (LRR) protein